ncbi:HNH endonuclease [Paenibacillus sp. CAU 1782]
MTLVILLAGSLCYTHSMTTNHYDPKDHQYKNEQLHSATKVCVQCGAAKPLTEFLRRTGRRSGKFGRRGACRSCRQREAAASSLEGAHVRQLAGQPIPREAGGAAHGEAGGRAKLPKVQSASNGDVMSQADGNASGRSAATVGAANDGSGSASIGGIAPAVPAARNKRRRGNKRAKGAQQRQAARPASEAPPPHTPRRDKHDPADASFLRPTVKGFIRMRGKTDNGRRWYQEVDPELAHVLVREGAAVVVNRSTIRRLYSSREFRRLILTRDNYTCHFCGKYGDTIDHKLPRAKGGHTTPVNCVCACYECNQLKANRDIDEFVNAMDEYMR